MEEIVDEKPEIKDLLLPTVHKVILPHEEIAENQTNSRKRSHASDTLETDAKRLHITSVPVRDVNASQASQDSLALLESFTSGSLNASVSSEFPPESFAFIDDRSSDCHNQGSTINVGQKTPISKETLNKNATPRTSGLSIPGTSKQLSGISDEELTEIIKGLDDDIDKMLDERAEKQQLTAKNVKSILKHVITNKYVLAMVRNTMKLEGIEEFDLEEAAYEPKLTRSKAKELREKQAVLPWPVSTPVKQNINLISNKLLSVEFPEDECSSDEEYKPHNGKTSTPAPTPNKTVEKNSDLDTTATDDFCGLIIDDPCMGVVTDSESDDIDQIALRTRSKLPLTDTSLATIEANFNAPDISFDMYDNKIDDVDWQNFLLDFLKPLDEGAIAEQPDDEGEDPEYNVMEEEPDEEHDDEEHEDDPKTESSDVVTKEEMKSLMSEILVTACQELNDSDGDGPFLQTWDENADILDHSCIIIQNFPAIPQVTSIPNVFVPGVKVRLEQQMRMHVQLLCQTFLLSHGTEQLQEINETASSLLHELDTYSKATNAVLGEEGSAYSAHNLDGALHVITDFPNKRTIATVHCPFYTVKETIAYNPVFMYPDLLPRVPFTKLVGKLFKPTFSSAEDILIVLGLDQFKDLTNPLCYIQSVMLLAKTEQQLKFRIKNKKSTHAEEDHPITQYFKYKTLPEEVINYRPFDPNQVLPPSCFPLNMLPPWMEAFVSNPPKCLNIPAFPYKRIRPTLCEKRKYAPILPRSYVSPLKKINPILKKYHQRPTKPVTNLRPIKPKPKFPDLVQTSPPVQPVSTVPGLPISPKPDTPKTPVPILPKTTTSSSPTTTVSFSPAQQNGGQNESTVTVTSPIASTVSDTKDNDKTVTAVSAEVAPVTEEELVDDEEDLQALMTASSTIARRPPGIKKKTKQHRDIEAFLTLLSPNLMESDPKKEEREKRHASAYLLCVMDTLKSDMAKWEQFLKSLCEFQESGKSVVQLFAEVNIILKDYPALIDDFVSFLLPEQAKECGKYLQYTFLQKIKLFLRKLEVYFSNQPQQLQKVLKTFKQLDHQTDLTSSKAVSLLQPLLRNQSHLFEEFIQLCPDATPPKSLMTDFEDVQIPNSDEEASCDGFEDVILPDVEDPYGGKDCPCNCHISSTDIRMQNRNRHCSRCGTKFLDGRIYIQMGKVLKPAQVTYLKSENENSSPTDAAKPPQGSSPNVNQSTSPSNKTGPSRTFFENATSKKQQEENRKNLETVIKTRSLVHDEVAQQSPFKSVGKAVSSSSVTESNISTLPCDVNEDAVLLPDSSFKTQSIPSDFSCLRKVISFNEKSPTTSPNSKHVHCSKESRVIPSTSAQTVLCSSSKCTFEQVELLSYPKPSTSNDCGWTREQDKLILETCQTHGVAEGTFNMIAKSLATKTAKQVQNRFFELMDLVQKKLKVINKR